MLRYIGNIVLFLISFTVSANIIPDSRIQPINNQGKLPSLNVQCIFEDKEGFMWFGTSDGLCRYDGYDIKIYKSSYLSPEQLYSNNINAISEDAYNRIWIGTVNGINILDKKTGKIKSIDNKKLSGNHIWSLLYAKDQTMWIATQNGLHRYDEKDGIFHVFQHDPNNPNSIPGNDVRTIFEDKKGNIWIGTWGQGTACLEKASGEFIRYPYIHDGNKALFFNRTSVIFQDHQQQMWIGAWGEGLFKMNLSKDPAKTTYERYDRFSEYERGIHTIVQDYDNRLLIGTSLGLDLITDTGNPSSYKSSDVEKIIDITNCEINALFQSSQDIIWVATKNEGVFMMYQENNKFVNHAFNSLKDFNQPLSVLGIYRWNKDELLLGLNKMGLAKFNEKTNTITHYQDDPELKVIAKSLGHAQFFFRNKQKDKDELWIGSEYGGLCIMGIKDHTMISCKQFYPYWGQWITGDIVSCIKKDNQENIWIGTNRGMNIITPEGDTLSYTNLNLDNAIEALSIEMDYLGHVWIATNNHGVYYSDLSDGVKSLKFKNYNLKNRLINCNETTCIFEDSKKRLWLGTKGGGLSKLNRERNRFEIIENMSEIPGDIIYSITEANNTLFLATNQGLVLYDPDASNNKQVTIYTTGDGLLANTFNTNAVLKDENGLIYLGTSKGLTAFDPVRLIQNTFHTKNIKIAITDIKIFHNSFENLPKEKKEKISPGMHPDFSKSITLSHKDYNFGIEFSALDFKHPEKTRYAYKLEGFDTNWNYVGADLRFAYYTNLQAGTYRFLIKGTNEYGYMNTEPEVLTIHILPPPYKTWWAYCLYAAIFLLIFYLLFRFFRYKFRMKQALKIEQMERDKSEELNQTKLRFFTNITHDLLTPLTIINCSVEELEQTYSEDNDVFRIMKANTSRLNRLIEQIIEFRKAEKDSLKLSVAYGDIARFISKICSENFSLIEKKNHINLSIECDPQSIPAWFDKDKIDKIMYNLLSNAFKYNKKNGKINIRLHAEELLSDQQYKYLTICVTNTGAGINKKDMGFLFTRFYEINYNDDTKRGNGIGLSLTKTLVELHHGSIAAESTPGEWTTFTIKIPINKESYSKDLVEEKKDIIDMNQSKDQMQEETNASNYIPKDKKYSILAIEDDQELLSSIKKLFSPRFTVYTCTSGEEGINLAKKYNPSLILTDILMPGMNGFLICKNIKEDIQTCHIPVVLLSGKVSNEDKLEGFNTGADAYITKPFSFSLLESQLNSIIINRELTVGKFKSTPLTRDIQIKLTSMDEKILEKAILIVEENLENPAFDVKVLIDKMAMSNSMLYRKLKSLTNLSPSEFIKNIRLKTASKLLLENKAYISEIAYKVGFNDPRYFTICFKKEFNMTPQEYIEKNL